MKHNIITYDDPREKGQALWESWIGKEIYEGIRKESEIEFSALYQQNPTTAEGNIFKAKYFKYYSETPDFITLGDIKIRKSELRIYQTIDPAGTVSQTADDFACITFALHENNIIVLDTFSEQALTSTHSELLSNLRDKWNPIYQAVENVGFGKNIIDNGKAYNQDIGGNGKKLASNSLIMPLETGGKNKIYRAEPLQVHFKNGLVWFNKSFSKLEKQLLEFPNGKHDDLVDCLAYAVLLLLDKPVDMVKAWDNIYTD